MKARILLLLSSSFLLLSCGSSSSSSSASSAPSSSSAPASSSVSSEPTSSAESTPSTPSSAPASESSTPAESSPSSAEPSSEPSSAESEPSSEAGSSSGVDPYSYEKETLVASLQAQYGEFSITPDDTVGAQVSFDETNNVYVLAVCADKAEYVVKGAAATHIRVEDVNNLGDGNFKGVKITLEGAALVSTDDRPVINYTLEAKNVQLSAKKGTQNEIYSLGSGDGVYSAKNIEVSGKGGLFVYTAEEHGLKAEGKITLYGSNAIEIAAGHDALHCNELLTTNDDLETFSGTVTVDYALSQAIEASTKKGKGAVTIDGGTWLINYSESVFKTDTTLTIGANAAVLAENIWSWPVVLGDASTSLYVVVEGTFTVDGVEIPSQLIQVEVL